MLTATRRQTPRFRIFAVTLLRLSLVAVLVLGSASSLAHDWPRATPAEAGLDSETLESLVEGIRQGEYRGLTSLVVVRRGRLIVEEYFGGYDGKSLHTMQSVSKSVSSAILGIAVDEGLIDTDDRVLAYFPNQQVRNRNALKERLTIEDLLTMRSGTDYHERGSDSPHSQLNRLEHGWDTFYLDRPMASEPGTRFRYDSGAVIVSSALIKSRTGQHADAYADSRLFTRLGIDSHRWHTNRDGHPHLGGGLYLRPLDMARFGQLYLDGGRWGDQQVISAEWIRRSFTKHVDLSGTSHDHVIGYGYWWWIFEPAADAGATRPFFAAYGANGQFIFVVPEFDLVVVVTGRARTYGDESAPMKFMYTHILRAASR